MAQFELIMPKMGESVAEATITNWLKKEGEVIEEDEAVLEIATDKVDSEVPSPVEGKLVKIEEGEQRDVVFLSHQWVPILGNYLIHCFICIQNYF